jgi:hypothetical protein
LLIKLRHRRRHRVVLTAGEEQQRAAKGMANHGGLCVQRFDRFADASGTWPTV